MKSYHTDNHITLHHGDALDVLRTLPDASVHAVVTDPPSGIAFMNMAWDDDRGGRAAWVAWLAGIMCEAYRVLKPGAHGLVWALPRTSHWTACALEDAGFEIREKVYHLQGAGFPKALDISKAIDQELGATREVTGETRRAGIGRHGRTDHEVFRASTDECNKHIPITAPATPEAAQWDGYKTALKPAAEEWILIRKPISERNVARNVLVHGTGGLNVDACRVGTAADMNPRDFDDSRRTSPKFSGKYNGGLEGQYLARCGTVPQGRYPPHVVFSHAPDCTDAACVEGCPVRALGEQSGVSVSKASQRGSVKVFSDKVRGSTGWEGKSTERGHDDTGTAARFFPVFRLDTSEATPQAATCAACQGSGIVQVPGITEPFDAWYAATKDYGGTYEEWQRLREPYAAPCPHCETPNVSPFRYQAKPAPSERAGSTHPTQKSLALMEWLVKLVTAPDQTVLDCFMGSGTTGVAALRAGRQFIGIEMDAAYFAIAQQRITEEQNRPKQLDMFGEESA
jgi:site-specific DNA-methyltransferase (adenine-specific)